MSLSALIPWPFKRKQYAGINNPRFVGDIVAANEAVMDGLQAITGLGNTDFAIISGLDYISLTASYSPGIIFLNGNFYVVQNGFIENQYLAASPTDFMPQAFQDGVSRNIYSIQYAVTSTVALNNSPLFSGNMNAYRIGLKYSQAVLAYLQNIAAGLGNSSTLNVGTTAGTVAAGNDPRLVYTQAQFNTIFGFYALLTNVLALNNVTAFTPTANYQPATKKYVDDLVGIPSGIQLLWLGNISLDGGAVNKIAGLSTVNVTSVSHPNTGQYDVNHNIGTANYYVNGIGLQGFSSPRSVINQTSNSFHVYVSDDDSGNDTPFQLQIYKYL